MCTRRSLGHHLLHPLIQIPNAFPENQKPSKIVKKIPQKRMRYSWQISKQSDRNSTRKLSKEIVPELQSLKPPLEVKVILKNEDCTLKNEIND